jgi:hypothetical protein
VGDGFALGQIAAILFPDREAVLMCVSAAPNRYIVRYVSCSMVAEGAFDMFAKGAFD